MTARAPASRVLGPRQRGAGVVLHVASADVPALVVLVDAAEREGVVAVGQRLQPAPQVERRNLAVDLGGRGLRGVERVGGARRHGAQGGDRPLQVMLLVEQLGVGHGGRQP
jgi:hypothetical protein